MKLSVSFSVAIAIILSSSGVVSFAPVSRRAVVKVETKTLSPVRRLPSDSEVYSSDSIQNLWQLHGHDESIDEDITAGHCSHRLGANRLRGVASKLKQKSKPVAFALATAASFASCLPGQSLFRPQAAHANAPIVLREKLAKNDPPMVQAMTKAKELKKKLSIEEFDRFMQKCNDIEDSEGKAARAQYEAQYKIDQEAKAAQKIVDIENLKRDLLDEGRDPNTDIDAENEVWILEHGIDLTKVPGTPHNEQMVKNFQSRGKNVPTYASQRYIVKCQVADLTARGIDPLEHFSQPEIIEKTRAIYKMDNKVAAKVAKQYEMLMEQNGGRITPAKEGETPFVRPSHDHKSNEASSASANDERAQEKAAAKAKRAAEREAAKQEKEAQRKAKAEAKARAKADLALAKEKQLAEKKLSKEEAVTASAAVAAAAASAALAAKESAAVAAATSSAHKAADSEIAATAQMDFAATAGQEAVARSALEDDKPVTKKESGNSLIENIKSKATVKNVATVVIGGGAAAYGFNYYMENNSGAQSEREKQLKLILGGDLDNDEDDEDDDDMVIDDDDDDFSIEKSPPKPSQTKAKSDETKASKPTPPSPEELPSNTRVKKRKLGIFSKKKANARETDLNALLSSGAKAPEFASLLAKILTFGAPGRFPAISNKGDMPFDEFELEKAKSMLEEARAELDLSEEEMAEIFASVVNCMIIDIIDLASSTLNLKDKDEKVTSDAINVVMDFMDHAASLFDSVAKDVTITPVTYGGDLGKKQLEQMFSIYSSSSMMSMDGSVSQDRVDTLQLVFGISDKKAEGLMQKHMMKMMMKMMKDPKAMEGMMDGMPGMEGMEDMLAALGGEGMPGMPGMPGMDGEMSPEDMKQTVSMMKELMDSGQVSDEELKEVRGQFKEMYGSDIADLIKKAEQEGSGETMGADEKDLLDMFKRILGDE